MENKGITALPVTRPTGNAIWLSEGQLILPSRQEDEDQPELINVYNAGGFIDSFPSPVKEPRHFQKKVNPDEVYLSGLDYRGNRKIYTLNIPSRSLTRFHFILKPLKNSNTPQTVPFSLSPQMADVGIQVLQLLFTLDDIKRAVPHPDGRYIALEVDGTPIIPIEKDVLGSLDPEMQKGKSVDGNKLKRYPIGCPKRLSPLKSIISMDNLNRYRMKFFYGEKITWYEAQRYYISFYLRGIETHMINANVGLTDLSIPLYALRQG